MTYQLLEPILEGGVRNSHYFNGRLLTADTLRQDQAASRHQRQQLGRAIGFGVVEGLMVSLESNGQEPVLRIEAGVALNREGQVLALPQTSLVALAQMDEAAPTDAGLFRICVAPAPGTAHSGRHIYLLVMTPTSGYRERAPMYDLSTNGDSHGRANGCGFRYAVEGVQFRLVRLDLNDDPVLNDAAVDKLNELIEESSAVAHSKLRNVLAHLALGTDTSRAFSTDLLSYLKPSTASLRYGLADLLRVDPEQEEKTDMHLHLSHCDVPLALLYWTSSGIQFVDNWAVRRRITPSYPATTGMPLVSGRRLAEGEAAFLQFQAQIADMTGPDISQAQLSALDATEYFRYLPALGIIPLAGTGEGRGFDYLNFFQKVTVRRIMTDEGESTYTHIEGAKLLALAQRSFLYPSVDLEDKEFLWLYVVRENRHAIEHATGIAPQMYLIFTSGHLPFVGDAQYDLNRWDYSNYGPILRGTFIGGE
jgi:hypothetical protein